MSRERLSKVPIKIVYVPINKIKPYPGNPRRWTDSQKNQVKQSLKRCGFADPIILSGAKRNFNTIVGGNLRAVAARELKMEYVPAVYITLSEARERELVIRLNKNTGSWDYDLLQQNYDYKMLLEWGFDDTDLTHLWDDALSVEEDEFDVEKELEKIKKPKTKLGNLHKLGSHFLICGDATDRAVVDRLVQKKQMDMAYIDTPFNISLNYDSGLGQTKHYGGKTNDRKSPEEYEKFLRAIYGNAIAVGKKDLHVFGWNDETNVGLMQRIFADLGLKNRRTCLWIKGAANVVPGVAFGKCYEACVYATCGRPYLSDAHQNFHEILNREVGSGNRAIDDILDVLNIWLERRIPGNEYEHATQKPVALAERPLKRCTRPGDAVLDLTGGSGTTLISCEQLKRRCFMAEIEPIFCDLTIRRFEALTGIKASLIKP